MSTTNRKEELRELIKVWNENRLEIFSIEEPDGHGEFWGVIRFCFQDSGQKVATKCVRVSNAATTADVIPVLIEKFRADIKMLSVPEYGLYEIHANGEERKLKDDEHPLMVQLDWAKDDREGRFLLRRMDDKTTSSAMPDSKKEKKEKKKKEKVEKAKKNENNFKDSLAEKLYTELPESCFTRSISNPEAVMRRKRKQKLEQKLQQLSREGGPDAGGTLRIYGECLNKDVPYKTLLLSTKDSAAFVVEQILDKYRDIDKNLRESNDKEVEPATNFCLVQVIEPLNNGTPSDGTQNHDSCVREYILDEDDCPLFIKRQHNPAKGILTFHIRRRPADYMPRKRKKKPNQVKDYEIGFNQPNNNVTRQMSDTSSTSGNVMPDSYHFDTENMRRGMDPILPAILELWEEGENVFLTMIISQLDPERVLFKLAPTYTLYMASRYRASTHFKKISREERAQRLTTFVDKAATTIHRTINEKQTNLGAVAFWLANSSELLHFLKQDCHLSHYTISAQESLAESVQDAFSILLRSSIEGLFHAMPSFLENPDREGGELNQAADLLRVLSSTMALLKKYWVNIALTLQIFSRLFHTINFWLFNQLISPTEKGINYCTEHRATILRSRLATIGEWAHKNGLELAVQCYSQRIEQALDFIIYNRRILSNPASYGRDYFKLNSLQVRQILEKFRSGSNEPSISNEVADALIRLAEEKVDELLRNDNKEVKLEEDHELPLPFLLPDDGYTCDIIRGLPAGLEEFIHDLVQANLCRFTVQPTSSGYWTIYMPGQQAPQGQHFAQPVQPMHMPSVNQSSVNHLPSVPRTPQPQMNQNMINQPLRMPPNSHLQGNAINQPPPRVLPTPQPQQQVPMHYPQDNGYRIYGNLQGAVRLPKYTSEPVLAVVPQTPISPPSPFPSGPVLTVIQLRKMNGGLGLSIVAAKSLRTLKLGIYIKSVVRGGAADLDGRLQPGDQLLSVNGKSLVNVSEKDAAELLTQSDALVTLEVAKQAAHHHGIAGSLADTPLHIQRAMQMSPQPPINWSMVQDGPPQYRPPEDQLRQRMAAIPLNSQTLPPNSLKNLSYADEQLRYRMANMGSHTMFPNNFRMYAGLDRTDEAARLRMSTMSSVSVSNQSLSQNSLKRSACAPSVSYRPGRSGYPGYPPQEHHHHQVASPMMTENNNLDKKETMSDQYIQEMEKNSRILTSSTTNMQPTASKTPPPPPPSQPQVNPQQPQLTHQIQPSQTASSLQQRINDHRSTHSMSSYVEPMIMNNGSSNNIPSNNVTSPGSKKVTWNGNTATLIPSQPPPLSSSSSLSFPPASSSSVKTNNNNNSNNDTEPHSPQEDHSFTLKDISEVLEMDDEQDPNNSKGGYTPNVIGAQEVYKDPRERIKAEKMKNQPQKNIPGPEKLTIKEKIRLFAEESNSQPK